MRQRTDNRILSYLRSVLNRTPLWLAFTVFMSCCLVILTLFLSFSNYRQGVSSAIERENESTSQMIDLKLQSLEQYLQELSDYCILPVKESEFYRDLLSSAPLSALRIEELQREVGQYYYTRTDLLSYRMDLLQQNVTYERGLKDQRMKTREGVTSEMAAVVAACADARSNYVVAPSESSNGLLRFSHTIIRVSDSMPVALVTIDVDQSVMRTGFTGQTVVLFSGDGEVLYTNAPEDLEDAILEAAAVSGGEHDHSSDDDTVTLAGNDYLRVCGSTDTGITLTVLTPIESITDEMAHLRTSSFLQGLFFLVLSIAVTIVLIRYLTAPLAQLADSQTRMAEGDFSRIHIGRCKETTELGRSFNDMSEHIDRLVNDNLIASINEKNARIEALEAQVSPHFLYNTLQAIGAEALLNDEQRIYEMLVRLANNMRYSINGAKEVTLAEELEFTENYIELQRLRMGEHLQVSHRVERELLGTYVPKCGLQQIVENTIKYGRSGDIDSLHLEIDIYRQGITIVIRVWDNGAGMSEERLEEIRERIAAREPARTTGIGLVNLSSRLHMMYGERAQMHIESSDDPENHHTCITLLLETEPEQRREAHA